MKITDVEIVQALHWPFVRIHTDEGISGIGEADTIKWYPFGHVAQLVTHEEEEQAVANMQAIREAVGPKVNIAVDVRNRLNTWSAVRMAQKLQPYDVFKEYPC